MNTKKHNLTTFINYIHNQHPVMCLLLFLVFLEMCVRLCVRVYDMFYMIPFIVFLVHTIKAVDTHTVAQSIASIKILGVASLRASLLVNEERL